MTPIYLNPQPSPFPLVDNDQHPQLFISSSPGSSCPTFSNSTEFNQRGSSPRESQQLDDQEKEHKGEPSDHQVVQTSSSSQPMIDYSHIYGEKIWVCKREYEDHEVKCDDDQSVKWMSSKMRLMRKMTKHSNCTTPTDHKTIKTKQKFCDPQHGEITIRVCSDCNTTKTPLWRSGPQGPKSLCNACGIRQRKARRAMAAAAVVANGTQLDTDTSSARGTIKVINKENKHITKYKKQYKPPDVSPQSKEKLCFEDFGLNWSKNSAFRRVFPQDEEEGAILLMALSCGFDHS